MTLSNLEQENTWIEAWNDLDVLIKKHTNCVILVSGYKEVSLEEAQGWIQEAAYSNHRIRFETGYYKGKVSIMITSEQ